jgi:bifunctional non-homologous end joining protein LigD
MGFCEPQSSRQRALVHLGRQPLKLVRHAHRITFYHRGRLPELPTAVHQLHIHKCEGEERLRVWVDDLDGLIGLVAMGAVELHPWNATVDDIEHADRIVIDLDPGEGVEWASVVDAALTAAGFIHASTRICNALQKRWRSHLLSFRPNGRTRRSGVVACTRIPE